MALDCLIGDFLLSKKTIYNNRAKVGQLHIRFRSERDIGRKAFGREIAMAARAFLVITIILFGIQGLSFGGTNKPFGQTGMVAAQPTVTVEIYITSWCPYCAQAIKFLQDNRIHTWRTISKKTAKPLDEKKGFPRVKAFHLQLSMGRRYTASLHKYTRRP